MTSQTRQRHEITVNNSGEHNMGLAAWLDGSPCVIVCGGTGQRLYPAKGRDLPKSMVRIGDRPIIRHLLDFWSEYTGELIIIINNHTSSIADYCLDLPYNIKLLFDTEPGAGIAAALLEAEPYINNKFVLVLGDCLYKGCFDIHSDMSRGIGIFKTNDKKALRENYSVTLDTNHIMVSHLEEKPRNVKKGFCGMGIYFLDNAIWAAIRNTPRDHQGVVQITSSLQTLADTAGLSPVFFKGDYININYPRDLEKARKIFATPLENKP